MKILLATLTSRIKDYAFLEWIGNVDNIVRVYGGEVDLFISDNSQDNDYCQYLRSFDIEVARVNPKGKTNLQYMTESHNQIREKMLRGGYDYLMHIESDVIPPWNVIDRLLEHQKTVISGMYFIGKGKASHPIINILEGGLHNGVSHTIHNGTDFHFYVDGSVRQVYACGLGCALIHRSVLEHITFRHVKGEAYHPDTWFYHDLASFQEPAYLHTGVLCEHRNQDWFSHYDMYNFPKKTDH